MSLLEVKNLRKVYTTRLGGTGVEALKNVSFAVEAGEFVAIMGESGSGKTTLLNILAALDRPSGGRVLLNGEDMAGVRERLESSKIPACMKGFPITLVSAGLMAVAFMGFNGLV